MKRPTVASLKKVNPENLAALGAERLAAILVEVAQARPDVKRRLRMELAAEQGAEHLAAEVDKRMNTVETSRGKVTWRRRAAFIRDLDQLRGLINGRLAELDRQGALTRLWQFMDLAQGLSLRVRDKDGELDGVFAAAAGDIGILADESAAAALADALADNPTGWARWLPSLLATAPEGLAQAVLTLAKASRVTVPSWSQIIRTLADATGDVDAYREAHSADALKTPPVAAELGRRLLAAGRIEEAGRALQAATPTGRSGIDFDWETVLIDYLEAAGDQESAQSARWAAFERTLSVERAKDFTKRLPDFEDVEAEHRAFDFAAAHRDAERGLAFLINWPALPEAARMILARKDDLAVDPERAELWAAKLRRRMPAAAEVLLRKGAALAFKQRAYKLSERLTAEADAVTDG